MAGRFAVPRMALAAVAAGTLYLCPGAAGAGAGVGAADVADAAAVESCPCESVEPVEPWAPDCRSMVRLVVSDYAGAAVWPARWCCMNRAAHTVPTESDDLPTDGAAPR